MPAENGLLSNSIIPYPCLVLIPGWGMHSGVWGEFVELLKQHFHIICLDLPGYNGSPSVSPYDLDTLAQYLMALIPYPHFSLFGWSLGATVALHMAIRYPQQIESLILLAGNPKFVACSTCPGIDKQLLDSFIQQLVKKPQLTQQRFLGLQVHQAANAKELLQELKTRLHTKPSPDLNVLQAGLELLKQSNLMTTLASLTCPITAIYAELDALVPVECAIAVQKINPAIKTHIIHQAPHAAFLSHPQTLVSLVLTAGSKRLSDD